MTFVELYDETERKRITDYVCEQIVNRRPMYKVFQEDKDKAKLCAFSTFNGWLVAFPGEVMEKVARAREAAATSYVEDIVQIADGKDDDPSADPNMRKVRIYAREKAAAMIAPRRFGQKLDLTSDGKALPAPQSNTLIVQDNRVQSLIALAAHRKAEKARLLDDD